MKRKMVLLLVLIGSFGQAFSGCCDGPVCWRGVYLSGQAGGAWGREDAEFTNSNYFNTLGPVIAGTEFDFKAEGFAGGAALGYQYQVGCWVLGAETGIIGTSLKRERPSPIFPDLDVFTSEVHWISNAKLRAGYAHKRLLTFISGGWAGASAALTLNDPDAGIVGRTKRWINGWTAGFGGDYRLTRCFSIGLSYDYIHLRDDNRTVGCPDCGAGVGFGTPVINDRLRLQTVLVRFNYIYNL